MSSRTFLNRVAVIVSLVVISFSAGASSIKFNGHSVTPINNDSMKLIQMEQRVNEIQAMDLADLSGVEKKNLRQELKQTLKEARTYQSDDEGNHHGVYLSIGALIVIILLLILLLR